MILVTTHGAAWRVRRVHARAELASLHCMWRPTWVSQCPGFVTSLPCCSSVVPPLAGRTVQTSGCFSPRLTWPPDAHLLYPPGSSMGVTWCPCSKGEATVRITSFSSTTATSTWTPCAGTHRTVSTRIFLSVLERLHAVTAMGIEEIARGRCSHETPERCLVLLFSGLLLVPSSLTPPGPLVVQVGRHALPWHVLAAPSTWEDFLSFPFLVNAYPSAPTPLKAVFSACCPVAFALAPSAFEMFTRPSLPSLEGRGRDSSICIWSRIVCIC